MFQVDISIRNRFIVAVRMLDAVGQAIIPAVPLVRVNYFSITAYSYLQLAFMDVLRFSSMYMYRVYVYTYICMYVCMYVCMYIYIYIYVCVCV